MEVKDFTLINPDGSPCGQPMVDIDKQAAIHGTYFDIDIIDSGLRAKVKKLVEDVSHAFDVFGVPPPPVNEDYEVSTFITMARDKEKTLETFRVPYPEKNAQVTFLNKKHKRAVTFDCMAMDAWFYFNAYVDVSSDETIEFPARGRNVMAGTLLSEQVSMAMMLGKIYEFLEFGVEDIQAVPQMASLH